MNDVTGLLKAAERGDAQAADELLPLIYDELRRVAGRQVQAEPAGQTLTATALVHEAYLRLTQGEVDRAWEGRRHFFHAAARAMRRILVDQARQKQALKRGARNGRVDLDVAEIAVPESDDKLLAIDAALDALSEHDPQAAQLVQLRFFSGMTVPEAAEVLGIGARSADRLWTYARAWLYRSLRDAES